MKQLGLASLKKKLDGLFCRFIRLRDIEKGCISCGKRVAFGGAWHAGHYYPRSVSYASLYFDEMNVHGQCSHCNTFLEGNKQGYREGLIKRYGESILEHLEIKKTFRTRWGVFEYETLIERYKKLVKNYESRLRESGY